MSNASLPHAVSAPKDVRDQADAIMVAARKDAPEDTLGRVNWTDISKIMAAWWQAKGYKFP